MTFGSCARRIGGILGVAFSALVLSGAGVTEITRPSSRDGVLQAAIFHVPSGAESTAGEAPVPLVVSLHSWSANYARYDSFASTLKGCQDRGWSFISPDFRGPNQRPEACASELAVQDVLDAVAYARKNARVDATRVYLSGASGGGHMALVMAHRAPQLWAGVSVWVPVTDVAAFRRTSVTDKTNYWKMVELCCGGPPGTPATDAEYHQRSPVHYLAAAAALPIDINTGIQDGHNGRAVPIDHSLRAFNVLAQANGHPEQVLPADQIEEMTATARVPAALVWRGAALPDRRYPTLFHRTAGAVRVTLFDGGHVWDEGRNGDAAPALGWLAGQRRKAAAAPAR